MTTPRRVTNLLAFALVLAFLVASSCEPTYSDCIIACAQDGACPKGLECKNGYCSSGALCDTARGTGGLAGGGEPPDMTGESGSAGSFGTGGNTETGGSASDGGAGVGAGENDGGAGSTGGSSDGGSGGDEWSPRALSGLVLWLDAGVGIETTPASSYRRVVTWRDRSRHRNDAHQSEAPMQPTVSADAANGLPALEFKPPVNFMSIADNPTLMPGEEHFTLEIVTAWKNSTARTDGYWGYGLLFSKQRRHSPFTGIGLLANTDELDNRARLSFTADIEFQTWSNANGLNDNQFRLCGVRRIADPSYGPGAIELRINGLVSAPVRLTVDPPNLDAASEPAYIGGQKATTFQALDGFIAEIVFIRGDLSDSELERLERYLKEKYSLW